MKRRRGGRHRLYGRPARGLEWVAEKQDEGGRGRGKHRLPAPTLPAAGAIAAGVVLLATSSAPAASPTSAPASPDENRPPAGDQVVPRGAGDARRLPSIYEASGTMENLDPGPVIPTVFTGEIPSTVLNAYRTARDVINAKQPGCHLPLELLEAIGKVETNHARGGLVDAGGTTLSPILGPVLDGNGFAAIPDTDGGRYDGDSVWDRAVGPMQFIPSTWAGWFADGNNDHRADPHNVYDASLAAARYLCAANRDLGTPDGLDQAIFSYNHSASYRNLVLAWMTTYSRGTIMMPDGTMLDGRSPVAITIPASSPSTSTPVEPPPVTDPPVTDPPDPPPTTDPPAQPPTSEPAPPPTTTPPPTEPPTTTPPPPTTTPPPTTEPPPPATEPPPPATEPPPPPPPTTTPTDPVTGLLCGVTGIIGGLLGGGQQNC